MTRAINTSSGSLKAGSRNVRYRTGSNSPRKNGKLVFQENSFEYFKADEKAHVANVQVSNVKGTDVYIKQTYAEAFMWKFSVSRSYNSTIPDFDMAAKLRNKIREGDFNAAVALGERKSTLELITGTASKLTKAARMVRKGKFKRACQTLDIKYKNPSDIKGAVTPANYWLQINYGWGPLLSDMTNAMIATDLAQQRAEKRQKRVSVYYKESKDVNETSLTNISIPYGEGSKRFSMPGVKLSGNRQTKIQLAAVITCDNPSLATVDSLGLINPAAVAWELVPFSFVVDWFIPIGDWVSATPPLWGYKIHQVYETRFQERTLKCGGENLTGKFESIYADGAERKSYYPTFSASCGGGNLHTVYVSRASASLDVKPPGFDFTSNIFKAVTGLSLLTQQLSNLIRKR